MHSLSAEGAGRRAGRRDRESGSTAVEFVILTPLLMLMLLALVQLSMYVFAQHVASTAAQAAARAGREDAPSDPGGWPAVAQTTADNWINDLIGTGVNGPIDVSTGLNPKRANGCTPQTVTVTVSFEMASLLGGMTAKGQSQGPVENFYLNNC